MGEEGRGEKVDHGQRQKEDEGGEGQGKGENRKDHISLGRITDHPTSITKATCLKCLVGRLRRCGESISTPPAEREIFSSK